MPGVCSSAARASPSCTQKGFARRPRTADRQATRMSTHRLTEGESLATSAGQELAPDRELETS